MSITPLLSRKARFIAIFGLLGVSLIASGCGALLTPGAPPARMQLSPKLPAVSIGKVIPKQILISRPLAPSSIDNDYILLLFHDRELRSLAKTRWESSIPRIVQSCITESLEKTGALQGVATEATGITVDVRLVSDIRQFALRYPTEDAIPIAEFSAQFKIVNMNSGVVLDSIEISTKSPAAGKDTYALVSASENALTDALARLTPWIIQVLQKEQQ